MQVKVELSGVRGEGKTLSADVIEKALSENFEYVKRVTHSENGFTEIVVFDAATLKK